MALVLILTVSGQLCSLPWLVDTYHLLYRVVRTISRSSRAGDTVVRRGAPIAQTGFCRDRKYRRDSKGDRFKVSSALVLGRSKVAFSLNHMLPVNLQASWNSSKNFPGSTTQLGNHCEFVATI